VSYEYSLLDGYPPEPYTEIQLIKYAGAWAFGKLFDLNWVGQPKSSIMFRDHVIDIQTYTQGTNLLCTVGQPYGEIIVMAALDLQEKRIRFLGWEHFASFSENIYPPKLFANRLCNYIHTSRLKHMSLLSELLEIEEPK
jgi:hypothetical protein